jgi:hypothetical protein
MLLITIILFLFIIYQDLKTRSIWWFLPALLFMALILLNYESIIMRDVISNALFILFLLGSLLIYIQLRFKNAKQLLSTYFGLGDILFLMAICPISPFPFFVHLVTMGTIFTLLFYGVMSLFKKMRTIPYAGLFSIFLLFYVAAIELNFLER